MKKILLYTLVLALFIPVVSFAQERGDDVVYQNSGGPKLDYSGFVKCDGVVKDDGTEPARNVKCDFAALMNTIIKLINWMFMISVPVAVLVLAYGGVLYMTGAQDKIKTAKKMFISVAIGFIIMATAWIAVRTVVDWFVSPDIGATTLIK